MIKFATRTRERGLLLGFGLSEENLRLLREGKPIRIDLGKMGLMKGEILIFYGKTEAEMVKEIKSYIGPETRVIGDPPPKWCPNCDDPMTFDPQPSGANWVCEACDLHMQ